jgi:uncharacterized protein YbcV (DUF1398 family)
MNLVQIQQISAASLNGRLTFPEALAQLHAAGVEYYYVDYAALETRYYSPEGAYTVQPLALTQMPAIAPSFDAAALRANILDSQLHGQHYQDFSRRALAAGVQGYFVFLRGQRVTYVGRTGDQHTEWFPGAAPTQES